jgi:hypothetical protein
MKKKLSTTPQSSTMPLFPSLLGTVGVLKKQYNDVHCIAFIEKIKSVVSAHGYVFAEGVCQTHGRFYGLAKRLQGGELEIEFVRVEREASG